MNASETSYPEGWEDYSVCASYDGQEWFRVPTSYLDGVLKFDITPTYNSIFFAYFAPYSYSDHQTLIHQAQMSDLCSVSVIGETVEGKDIDMLVIGKPGEGKKKVWMIARQHPGESMAEWFVEGFLSRLMDENDAVSRRILENSCVYVIPNMNIDGAIAGNLRSNTAGANLNREWESPSLERSPEVFYALKKMDEIGVDLLLDVHGDEAIPYNFVAGSEGIPGYHAEMKRWEDEFKQYWMNSCPDFQDEHNYGPDAPGSANMTICTNQISARFDCLALTIEMPFKDNDDLPDEVYGWSGDRSAEFGESVLQPVWNFLRTEME